MHARIYQHLPAFLTIWLLETALTREVALLGSLFGGTRLYECDSIWYFWCFVLFCFFPEEGYLIVFIFNLFVANSLFRVRVCEQADWKDPAMKIPGDDTLHIADRFTTFLDDRVKDGRPWLAHLCIHSIHEPHPAMPAYYAQ